MIIVLQETGRVLLPGPFIPSAVRVAHIINEYGTAAQKDYFLPKMTTGEIIISPALYTPQQYAGESQVDSCEALENNNNHFFLSGSRVYDNVQESVFTKIMAARSLGRMSEPHEISPAFIFLASDDASYITGQILGVDGGLALWSSMINSIGQCFDQSDLQI